MAGKDVSREIADWAAHRYGLVSRTKLLALGLTRHQVDARLGAGWLLETDVDGLYFVGHRSGVPGQREALALAGAGPSSVLSGVSAAAWHGMTDPWRGKVHLIVPAARSAQPDDAVRHLDRLAPEDSCEVRGLACVTPGRAVMDLPPGRLRQGLQWLMKRGVEVEPIVERMHGRRGAKAFRAEVALLVPQMAHTMSELEDRFLRLCVRYGIPLPIVNGTLAGGDLLDCTWPGHRLVVELDGRRWHEHRDREDRARDRRRVEEGRATLRYDWRDVTADAEPTARQTLAVLAASRETRRDPLMAGKDVSREIQRGA